MTETTNFSVRIDKQIKQESEALLKELGMNLTTAINVFLKQAVRTGGLPFELKLNQPNQDTLLALIESDRLAQDNTAPAYDAVEAALEELKA